VTGVKMFADNRLFWTGNAATLRISSSFLKSDFYLSRNNSVAERERRPNRKRRDLEIQLKSSFSLAPFTGGSDILGGFKTQKSVKIINKKQLLCNALFYRIKLDR
jgi:hypothetical protein